MTFPKLGPPSNLSKQNYANELQKHLCNATASLLKYTFIQSFHGFLYCEILSGRSAAQVCKSLLHTTWIKLLPLAPLNFACPYTSVFHGMQHQKALFFFVKKTKNSLKFTMFKYNDLQGIAGFFSGNAQVLKFIISQARMKQKNSTFHLCNYFLSISLFFHGRFHCTTKKMATLYRLWIQQHNFIAKIYSKLSIFKFWRKINFISEFTHSSNSQQSCWRYTFLSL